MLTFFSRESLLGTLSTKCTGRVRIYEEGNGKKGNAVFFKFLFDLEKIKKKL